MDLADVRLRCGAVLQAELLLCMSKSIPNRTSLHMGELPPDRRTKKMPQLAQAPFPLVAHSSCIALI